MIQRGNAARAIALMGGALMALTLTGCPQPPPPFDVSGVYEGTYGLVEPGFALPDACPIFFELYHEPQIPFIASTFAGVAWLDWDCLLNPAAQDLLGITTESLRAPVLAVLRTDGTYELNIAIDSDDLPNILAQQIDDETLDIEILQTFQEFEFSFTGFGEDVDKNGFMDQTVGTLSVLFSFIDEDGALVTIDEAGEYEAVFIGETQ